MVLDIGHSSCPTNSSAVSIVRDENPFLKETRGYLDRALEEPSLGVWICVLRLWFVVLLRHGRLPSASQLGRLGALGHGANIGQTQLRLSLLSRDAACPSPSGAARQWIQRKSQRALKSNIVLIYSREVSVLLKLTSLFTELGEVHFASLILSQGYSHQWALFCPCRSLASRNIGWNKTLPSQISVVKGGLGKVLDSNKSSALLCSL